MDNIETIKLIHKKIDSELTTREQEQLNRVLSDFPEMKKLHDELTQTCSLIGSIEQINPSPELRKTIMNSIDPKRYTQETRSRSKKISGTRIFARPRVKYGLTFAAGALVSALVLIISSINLEDRIVVDETNFMGTIGGTNKMKAEKIDGFGFHTLDIKGEAALKRLDNIIECDLQFQASEDVEMLATFDQDALGFLGVRPQNLKMNFRLESDENSVTTYCENKAKISLYFLAKTDFDSQLKMTIFQNQVDQVNHVFTIQSDKNKSK